MVHLLPPQYIALYALRAESPWQAGITDAKGHISRWFFQCSVPQILQAEMTMRLESIGRPWPGMLGFKLMVSANICTSSVVIVHFPTTSSRQLQTSLQQPLPASDKPSERAVQIRQVARRASIETHHDKAMRRLLAGRQDRREGSRSATGMSSGPWEKDVDCAQETPSGMVKLCFWRTVRAGSSKNLWIANQSSTVESVTRTVASAHTDRTGR